MRRTLLGATIALAAFGQVKTDHPTGNRTTPPTINSVSPGGVARGTTVELTVEGLNLAGAQSIHFDKPGVIGRIVRVKELPDLSDIRLGSNGTPSTVDLGPLPPRNQVTVEIDVTPEALIGPIGFRIQTPLGTSPDGRFLIEPYYGESPDNEPNNSPDTAFESFLPSVLVGAISRPGDVDYFKIKVKAGEELVFENGAMLTGSSLQPVVSILQEDGSVSKEYGTDGGDSTAVFAHKFAAAGTYYVRVSDYQQSGRAGHAYRIKVGNFPYATSTYPLGIAQGKMAEVQVRGYGLPRTNAQVKGEAGAAEPDTLRVRPVGSFNEIRVGIGQDPEMIADGANVSLQTALPVTLPVTVNGRIAPPKATTPTENYYRFSAKKGQKLVLEVAARRLDSHLDSVIEVLDSAGKPIETAVARAISETFTTLRDHDSAQRGIRMTSVTGLAVGNYLMSGGEIMRIDAMPPGPDDDLALESFAGQRLSFFGTSGEAHHVDRSVYKVQMHPPGTQFTPNGLPLVRLQARNDDGGPAYGKDSKLDFTAPADGEYVARIRDVRGLGGDDYAYRLNIRPPRPDFRLTATPRNPNVPAGGAIPVTVTALRMDGYDGPIDIAVEGLPDGIKAHPAVIQPGQISTTVTLSAPSEVKPFNAVPFQVVGRAKTGAETIARHANPEDGLKLVALASKGDIHMTAVTREIVLEPGRTADITVAIERLNGFAGRVPVEVRNLPPRVRVIDTGLNGVLINEDETKRSFTVEALDSAEAVEQLIYVSGRVETRSPLQTSYVAVEPVLLKVLPRKAVGPTVSSAIRD